MKPQRRNDILRTLTGFDLFHRADANLRKRGMAQFATIHLIHGR